MQFMLVTHLVLVSVWGSAVQDGWFDFTSTRTRETTSRVWERSLVNVQTLYMTVLSENV